MGFFKKSSTPYTPRKRVFGGGKLASTPQRQITPLGLNNLWFGEEQGLPPEPTQSPQPQSGSDYGAGQGGSWRWDNSRSSVSGNNWNNKDSFSGYQPLYKNRKISMDEIEERIDRTYYENEFLSTYQSRYTETDNAGLGTPIYVIATYHDSMPALAETLQRHKSLLKKGGRHSSKKTEEEYDSWTGTENYKDAHELACMGWSKAGAFIDRNLSEVNLDIKRADLLKDVAGQRVIVPVAVSGDPLCMESPRVSDEFGYNQSTLYIDINPGVNWRIKTAVTLRAGISLLRLCMYLEQAGIYCGIRLHVRSFCDSPTEILDECDNNILGKHLYYKNGDSKRRTWWEDDDIEGILSLTTVDIKRPGERIDAAQIAFGIAHPSFLRRIVFRMEECTNFYHASGYGTPMRSQYPTSRMVEKLEGQDRLYIPWRLHGDKMRLHHDNLFSYEEFAEHGKRYFKKWIDQKLTNCSESHKQQLVEKSYFSEEINANKLLLNK